MAGRGRAATLPAWMTSGAGASGESKLAETPSEAKEVKDKQIEYSNHLPSTNLSNGSQVLNRTNVGTNQADVRITTIDPHTASRSLGSFPPSSTMPFTHPRGPLPLPVLTVPPISSHSGSLQQHQRLALPMSGPNSISALMPPHQQPIHSIPPVHQMLPHGQQTPIVPNSFPGPMQNSPIIQQHSSIQPSAMQMSQSMNPPGLPPPRAPAPLRPPNTGLPGAPGSGFGQPGGTGPGFAQQNGPGYGQFNVPGPGFGQPNIPGPGFGQSNVSGPGFGQPNVSNPGFGQPNPSGPGFGQPGMPVAPTMPMGMPGVGLSTGMGNSFAMIPQNYGQYAPVGLPNGPPSNPMGFYMPGPAMPPRGPPPIPATAPSSGVVDPNNDVMAWSEHETDDGRKYWYNRLTQNSTYEKPTVLKTPEERSIPPCQWKEYSTPEGKKYYSNGKESLWTMPEEFRAWKDKVDALEKKKLISAAAPVAASESANAGGAPVGRRDGSEHHTPVDAPSAHGGAPVPEIDSSSFHRPVVRKGIAEEADSDDGEPPVAVSYATKEEAIEAFKTLLTDKRISASMRMKEVQDACQNDPRWNALKNAGEKKQALAEYQTKKLKAEKELQKNKARKCRDNFLLMLAENVEIDAKTRYRDAVEFLQGDPRFNNVEDAREREELFNDFVLELEKKEKEDRARLRDSAIEALKGCFVRYQDAGDVTRKSTWSDCKHLFTDQIKDLKGSVEETDVRRAFQDFVDELDSAHRMRKREKRDQLQVQVDSLLKEFRLHLERLAKEGVLVAESRWKDFVVLPQIAEFPQFREACALLGRDASGMDNGDRDDTVASAAASLGVLGGPRETFDKIQAAIREAYRVDKRLIRDVLEDSKFEILHDTQFSEVKTLVFKAAGLKETVPSSSIASIPFVTEDGEELEDTEGGPFDVYSRSSGKSVLVMLRSMLTRRLQHLQQVFTEMQAAALAEREEELRRAKRREDRFVELLEVSQFFKHIFDDLLVTVLQQLLDDAKGYYYRSDHIGVTWDEAKKVLERHSAYDALVKADRKRLFSTYMDGLSKRMEAKTKSMQSMLDVPAGAVPAASLPEEVPAGMEDVNQSGGDDDDDACSGDDDDDASGKDSLMDKDKSASKKRKKVKDRKEKKSKKHKKESSRR